MGLTINQLIQAIQDLAPGQRSEILALLAGGERAVCREDELRELRFSVGIFCPACRSRHIRKYGKYRNRQRYQCKTCRRTFNDYSATPLHRTKLPRKWADYLECMVAGHSIRKSADLTSIDPKTSFTWRHKILHALTQAEEGKLRGIVEVDEAYELYSAKGCRRLGRLSRRRGGKAGKPGVSDRQACIVIARDRVNTTLGRTAGLGHLTSEGLKRILREKMEADATLCSDAGTAFLTFCRELNLWHETVNISKGLRTRGIYHIQNVNAVYRRFKDWSIRFNGVATKYLDNYWAWFNFLERTAGMTHGSRAKRLLLSAARGIMRTDGVAIPRYYDALFAALCA